MLCRDLGHALLRAWFGRQEHTPFKGGARYAPSFLLKMALFRRRNVGQAFRTNRQLQQFVLTDVTPTGRLLGTGSYGSVEEVSPALALLER